MDPKAKAKQLIKTVETGNYYIKCPDPDCNQTFLPRNAHLFYLDDFNKKADETYKLCQSELEEMRNKLKLRKGNIKAKSEIGAKAVNIGFILERMAPSMKDFPFCCNDCRSLFDPIDYVVFEGLANHGVVNKMLWVEIKTGGARLSQREKQIKDLVDNKKIEWDTYKAEDTSDE